MTSVFLEDSFDAARYLPRVSDVRRHKRMYGHTYRVRLEVTGEVVDATGWVMDYADLKRMWEVVKSGLNHCCLNDFVSNPTCELIARYIGDNMKAVSRIEIRERLNCGAVWQR